MTYEQLQSNLLSTLQDAASTLYGDATPPLRFDRPPSVARGELALPCFPLARAARKNPALIAQELNEAFTASPLHSAHIKASSATGPYINITFKGGSLFTSLYDGVNGSLQTWGHTTGGNGQKVMVEFSAPNTNKPLHLGHIRNNALGHSVCNLLDAAGYEVIRANLINDRGVHICKSMLAYQKWGKGATPESTGKKGDHFVGDYYVMFSQALKKQQADIKEAAAAETGLEGEKLSKYLEVNAPLSKEAQAMLLAWEEGDESVRALWTMMNTWVLKGFDESYKRMGVYFDHIYKESETYQLGRQIVRDQLAAGKAFQKEDNSIWIDLEDLKLGTKILLRGDGTSVYFTQDLGTAVTKENEYHMNRSIYVVANEQELHFRRLFAALDRFDYPNASGLFHLSYGMVNLPDGKMKSREGTVVDADQLMDELEAACFKKSQEAKAQGSMTQNEEELHKTAQDVSLGSMLFFILKVNPRKAMIFNPKESIKLTGDTGPYVQYAYARTQSLLARGKAKELMSPEDAAKSGILDQLGEIPERALAQIIGRFPQVVKEAAEKLSPSTIASYLIELAGGFNKFYNQCPVLKADPELAAARLALCDMTGQTLKIGLNLMGIPAPKAM